MKRLCLLFAFLALTGCLVPESYEGYELVWHEEFNGRRIDTAYRDFGHDFKKKGKFSFKSGRMEVRARIPVAKDVWPEILTFGIEGERPSYGETYVMKDSCFTQRDSLWTNSFHVWTMDWDHDSIHLYIDGELLKKFALVKSPGEYEWGNVDGSRLPMKYETDYVRVYRKIRKPYRSFSPGKIWEDVDGEHLNVHGGGVLYHDGTYYFYGECKSPHTGAALHGVSVYSSKDLYNWKNEGIALAVMPENSGHRIEKGCTIERPKVVYNEKTGKFVMWFHLELKGQGYKAALYGVAVSDTPLGPFKYLYSCRSCPGVWPVNMTEEQIEYAQTLKDKTSEDPFWRQYVRDGFFLVRDYEGGQMSRDMTIFVDDDGVAYHIFASENNQTLHIAKLTDDYLYHSGEYSRALPGKSNEAPAIFKKDGVYWMISSGCTGWKPNKARLSCTTDIMGEWKSYPNPCVGPDEELTFKGQSTFILPVHGRKDAWIFMADIWYPHNLRASRYVWLPVTFDESGVPVLEWRDEWTLKDAFGK